MELTYENKLLLDLGRKNLSFTMIDLLSQNGRALVVVCQISDSRLLKVLKISESSEFVGREICCLCQLSHPNIVSLERTWRNEKAHYMLLEKVPGRSLIDILIDEKRFLELEAFKIAIQTASALDYLHKAGWVHRDVKPDNMIYNRKTGSVKLIDFEFSCKISDRRKMIEKKGTIQYLGPEVRKGEILLGPELDVFSFGISLFVMVCGYFPWDQTDSPPRFLLPENLPFPYQVSSEFRDLVEKMLIQQPAQRITIEEIKIHPWITRDSVFKPMLDWFKWKMRGVDDQPIGAI